MIFELAQDFYDAVAVIPQAHAKHRMLELLEEAVRRDVHFIDRHPTTLFQCMSAPDECGVRNVYCGTAKLDTEGSMMA